MTIYNWRKDPDKIGCYTAITIVLIVVCVVVVVAKQAVS
jgi:hypothetical protein